MSVYITLHNGLGNRLLPMLSILRFAKESNQKLYIHWTGKAGRSCLYYEGLEFVTFYDLFRKLDNVEEISEDDIRAKEPHEEGLAVKYHFHYSEENPHVMKPLDNEKDTFVFMAILPVLRESEADLSSKRYKFHDPEYGYFTQDAWYKDVKSYFHLLKPVTPLDRIINVYSSKFRDNMIGIHLRKTDGGFADMNWDEIDKHIISRIYEWKNKDSTIGVFLATDCADTTRKFKKEFGNDIIVFDPPEDKHRNNAFNNRCAVVDMFLLSKCNKLIIGTFGSTFGLCAALLSKDTPFFVMTNDKYELPKDI